MSRASHRSAPRRRALAGWLALALVCGIAAAFAFLRLRAGGDAPEAAPAPAAVANPASLAGAEPAAAAEASPTGEAPASPSEAEESMPGSEAEDASGDPLAASDWDAAIRWAQVDMDAVRVAMPDNLYWEMGLPSTDPETLRRRQEKRAQLDKDYGKLLSGTATQAEIRDYYAYRYQLSTDYVEFTGHLLEHYASLLPERDVGLLQLSQQMHHARLQEMPRRISEALARKSAQDAAREQWLRDQAEFGAERSAPARDSDD